jgi:hypothetical protein
MRTPDPHGFVDVLAAMLLKNPPMPTYSFTELHVVRMSAILIAALGAVQGGRDTSWQQKQLFYSCRCACHAPLVRPACWQRPLHSTCRPRHSSPLTRAPASATTQARVTGTASSTATLTNAAHAHAVSTIAPLLTSTTPSSPRPAAGRAHGPAADTTLATVTVPARPRLPTRGGADPARAVLAHALHAPRLLFASPPIRSWARRPSSPPTASQA